MDRGPGATLRALDERYSGLTLLLVAVDLVAGAATSILVLRLPFWWVVAVTTFMVASRTTARLYRRRLRLSYFDDLPKTLAATCSAFGVVIAAIMLLGQNSETSLVLLYAVLLFLLVSEPLRALVFQVARTARRRLGRGDRTLVVGTDPVAVNLVRNMLEHPEFGLRPVGFVDPQPQVDPDQLPVPLLRAGLAATITEHRIGTVVLGHTASGESQTVEEAIIAHQLGCMTLIVPRLDELYRDGPDVERLRSYPLIRLPVDPTRRPAWYVKRAADVGLAAVGLAAVLPVMAVCAAAILIESGRPVLFGQERIGLHGRPFRIYKLCTLTPVDERESATRWNVADDPRITATGRFLRRTSLDELPQLWNVLRGEMSLVGPRPERPGFVQRFSADHERYWARHRVPPGLTGLAQVNGLRGDTSIADRARYDNYYIANWSLWLDLKIILLTGREILRGGNR